MIEDEGEGEVEDMCRPSDDKVYVDDAGGALWLSEMQ